SVATWYAFQTLASTAGIADGPPPTTLLITSCCAAATNVKPSAASAQIDNLVTEFIWSLLEVRSQLTIARHDPVKILLCAAEWRASARFRVPLKETSSSAARPKASGRTRSWVRRTADS